MTRHHQRSSQAGFSLVEVVLAIGIFSFAIITMLGLFGASIADVRRLANRDISVSAGYAIAEKVGTLTRADLLAVPSGTDPAGRPTFYAYAPKPAAASDALSTTDTPVFVWSNSIPPDPANVTDGRVFRATVYRAHQDASTEFPFDATNVAFPVRVVVEVLAPGQSSGPPLTTWCFHRSLIPTQ